MIKEKRQARRQPLRYTAWVAVAAEQRLGCVVSDVSDTGARIDVQDSTTIPDHFVLMLSSNGAARRRCSRASGQNGRESSWNLARRCARRYRKRRKPRNQAVARRPPPPKRCNAMAVGVLDAFP